MNIAIVLGAGLIVLLFLLSGVEKLFSFSQQAVQFAKKFHLSLTLAQLVMSAVIVLEIVAPLIIVLYSATGHRLTLPFVKMSLIGLMIFTLLCNALYHWPATGSNYMSFVRNLSTVGGLMILYVHIAGV